MVSYSYSDNININQQTLCVCHMQPPSRARWIAYRSIASVHVT